MENDPIIVDSWTIVARRNQAGNLTIEVALDGVDHAEIVLQENGIIDLGSESLRWDLNEKGWSMPGAPNEQWRKFRFERTNSEPSD